MTEKSPRALTAAEKAEGNEKLKAAVLTTNSRHVAKGIKPGGGGKLSEIVDKANRQRASMAAVHLFNRQT